MLKRIIVLILISSLFFSFAACNRTENKQPGDGQTKTASGEYEEPNDSEVPELLKPTSNKINVWGGLYETIQESFAQKYPDYEVEYTDVVSPFVPDRSVDLPKLGSAVASGEAPDIFEARMSPPEAYYSNLFDPIEPYLKADTKFNINDIDPGLLDVTTFNDIKAYKYGVLGFARNRYT